MISCVERLHWAMKVKDTMVCCGLDPDLNRMPLGVTRQNGSSERKAVEFLQSIIDFTAPHVCAYKVQKAFFDVWRDGHAALQDVIAYAHERSPDTPVFLDCKIGDIDNTMTAYLDNVFGHLHADGVVVNPYMGDDVMTPFASLPDKAAIVLVKTSNPGGTVMQDIRLANGKTLWMHTLDLVVHRWNEASNMIPVLTTTSDVCSSIRRSQMPSTMPILLAGFGAQGGTAQHIQSLLSQHGSAVFVNSSRELLYPSVSQGSDWREATTQAVTAMKQLLNDQRRLAEEKNETAR